MRPILLVLAIALTSAPVFAQTAPAPMPAAPLPAAHEPVSPGTSTPRPAHPVYRQTLEQRFEHANTAKDGRLTKAQAEQAHWTYITRNFDAIDKTHAGFVTVDSIRAYARDRRAARQNARQNAGTASANQG